MSKKEDLIDNWWFKVELELTKKCENIDWEKYFLQKNFYKSIFGENIELEKPKKHKRNYRLISDE